PPSDRLRRSRAVRGFFVALQITRLQQCAPPGMIQIMWCSLHTPVTRAGYCDSARRLGSSNQGETYGTNRQNAGEVAADGVEPVPLRHGTAAVSIRCREASEVSGDSAG